MFIPKAAPIGWQKREGSLQTSQAVLAANWRVGFLEENLSGKREGSWRDGKTHRRETALRLRPSVAGDQQGSFLPPDSCRAPLTALLCSELCLPSAPWSFWSSQKVSPPLIFISPSTSHSAPAPRPLQSACPWAPPQSSFLCVTQASHRVCGRRANALQ